jgi:hypothetical protein
LLESPEALNRAAGAIAKVCSALAARSGGQAP